MDQKKKKVPNLSRRLLSLLGVKFKTVDTSEHQTRLLTDIEVDEVHGKDLIPKALKARYKFERILGKGGYGVVYLVRDVLIGRLVAMKLLNQSLIKSEEIYSHFIQEARIAGQLDHENIVVIYNVEDSKESACIIMEYLAEGSLAGMLEEQEKLTELDAVKIALGVLDGLSVAHKMKVIHRDIKPENILFDPKGRPKISDFGIAHLPPEEGGVGGENEYKPVGTPVYMAPEQLNGDASIDHRADLYSVGAIFYEMVTGRKLYNFENDTSLRVINSVIENQVPEPINTKNGVSEGAAAIIMRLLHKDPEQRYSSAREAIADIKMLSCLSEKKETQIIPDYTTSRVDLLEDVLRLLLVDGLMSPAERRELERRAQRLDVDKETARMLEARVREEMDLPTLESIEAFQETVAILAADGELSKEDRVILKEKSEKLGIQAEEREMIQNTILNKKEEEG